MYDKIHYKLKKKKKRIPEKKLKFYCNTATPIPLRIVFDSFHVLVAELSNIETAQPDRLTGLL